MDPFGLTIPLLLLFITFGFTVGVLFGFFGMGGAFLITPTLLILNYPAPVAIGSGLAFYFGTSVIAVMKHYDIGQVNYKLGAVLFIGLTLGIEAGRIVVFGLEELGIAQLVTSVGFVVLLAGIGMLFLKRAAAAEHEDGDSDGDEIPEVARRIQSYRIPPMLSMTSGGRASAWTISGVGGVVGVIAGMLGVGGGFLRMPAIYYVIGTPLAVAVGTSLFAGLFSGAFGTFTYGMAGSVDLVVVSTLLVGSALGARIGSAATTVVDEDGVIVYFGYMMLIASVAIALSELSRWIGVSILEVVSVVLLVGSSFVVASLVLYRMAASARGSRIASVPRSTGDD